MYFFKFLPRDAILVLGPYRRYRAQCDIGYMLWPCVYLSCIETARRFLTQTIVCILFWNIRCRHRGIRLRSSFHYVYVCLSSYTVLRGNSGFFIKQEYSLVPVDHGYKIYLITMLWMTDLCPKLNT